MNMIFVLSCAVVGLLVLCIILGAFTAFVMNEARRDCGDLRAAWNDISDLEHKVARFRELQDGYADLYDTWQGCLSKMDNDKERLQRAGRLVAQLKRQLSRAEHRIVTLKQAYFAAHYGETIPCNLPGTEPRNLMDELAQMPAVVQATPGRLVPLDPHYDVQDTVVEVAELDVNMGNFADKVEPVGMEPDECTECDHAVGGCPSGVFPCPSCVDGSYRKVS